MPAIRAASRIPEHPPKTAGQGQPHAAGRFRPVPVQGHRVRESAKTFRMGGSDELDQCDRFGSQG